MEPKFYKQTRIERIQTLIQEGFLNEKQAELFIDNPLLDDAVANSLIENQVTQFPLPLGVARNFKIDGQKMTIPMVVEEPSVIAACSNAAKIMKTKGFSTNIKKREMIGQIILKEIPDLEIAKQAILDQRETIFKLAEESHPSIVSRGGGLKDISVRLIEQTHLSHSFLTIHLMVDVKDAMGANIINTILEGVTPFILELTTGASLMSILSNYNTECLVTATCCVPFSELTTSDFSGYDIAKKIVEANTYAKLDPYRAATHNKGIMNGIDSVVIATGNDPRAVEAGAHAYASRHGQYEAMTNWEISKDCLIGELTLPMAVGSVGGAISVLPMAKVSLDMLNVSSSEELARVVMCVGLAQNFAALKALVTVGIQKGHMNLHASSLAIQVGAKDEEIAILTKLLRKEAKMNSMVAKELLEKIRS
ncbi:MULTISPECIES: hydroxymethylglutaryl-CoA reductase, degradative [Vagococcus]|uniref:3-hydroxy-3-methylglutaryl coenzyme A reductase n=1 Tax=Vagococcus fluvialis bH819 TaxID=1255619 RepID=A0A1X6WJT0_9ENTE|nr:MULTISPECIES: hydroxymethylglutaryl-CoA reductase, degradative [Vagococcus]SLM84551.1 Hydroxymethylglutaryl-CoA reductase [Vagococcus fluvialis bH819]HCM89984.1 hydroxymethylglutaryl-CoA reductase, degradative [Vagococcus sp.]